jgi:hypothetical protein
MKLNKDEVIRFILNRKYFLKLYRIPRSQWRRKAGTEIVQKYGCGNSDLFIECWTYLEEEGLL